MTRHSLLFLIAVTLAAVLSACGGATPSTLPEATHQPPLPAIASGGGEPPPPAAVSDAVELLPVPTASPVEPLMPQAAEQVCSPPVVDTPPPPSRIRQMPPPAVGAASAVVIDGGSGAVLWGRGEHEALQPASVTKVLTALVAVERGNLDEVIQIDLEQRLLNRGSRMGLVTGDWFSLRDLLYGLMLPSGNDAAAVIAHHVAGGEREFAELMNQRLCRLGLVDSRFINPSGLGRGEFNLASAYDLAQVTRAAMEYPAFRSLAAAPSWVARGSRTLWLRNLNELVANGYPGVDGVKIGWTPGAGNTIVASMTRGGHQIIVVLLRTPNRAGESAALLEWAFSAFAWPG